jgi:hypothetical protein
MKSLKYTCIVIILLSVLAFGQTYNGPTTESVDSGVVVSTHDFTNMSNNNNRSNKRKINQPLEYESGPLYYDGDEPAFNDYVYVDDKSVVPSSQSNIGTSFELQGFPANGMTNFDPPDNAFAVGPNHVMTSVNMNFSIWDKQGNLMTTIDGVQWFSQVTPAPEVSGDPQVIYDHYDGRWFFLFMGIWDSGQQASHLICYSDDDNPVGTWYMYRLPTTTWGDYPHVGYDDQGIYITTNNFPISGGSFLYVQLRILNKSELYASYADSLSYVDIWNISLPNTSQLVFSLQPAISFTPGNNAAYFAWNNGGFASFYSLYKLTDPVTNPVLTGVRLPVPSYDSPNDATQLGGNSLIDNLSRMTSVPVLRDGKLYAVHAIENSQFSNYGSLKYFVVDVSSNTVLEQVEFGAQGYFYLFPSIIVDKDHNIAITYSRSGNTEYVGAFYSTKLSTDLPGLSPSKVMMEGQGNYNRFSGNSVQRWGDYFATSLDPVTEYNLWLYSEYAAARNTWGTWLTEIRMKPLPGVSLHSDTNPVEFNDIEVGATPANETVTISNYGEDDLIINSITSPTGPFTLLTPMIYPDTLSTYDCLQLEIEFNPDSVTIYSLLMAFDDNDPNFDGLTLKGTAYEINSALKGTLYSSTGVQENGKILTVDKNSGAGTELGLSNFNELNSLAIQPVTDIIYGISTSTSETELVRVNATGGDAFTQYTLDIGLMSGIAFDTSGTLYGAIRAGDIYTIDLSDGSYNFDITASIEITSIAFDPATNELWASPRIVFGPTKDRIYKIDLTTGDATLVGETGFDVTTNDLAFDDDETLFGVIGDAAELGELITISTTDAAGSLVGQIGYNNVLGLAYNLTGDPSGIKDETEDNAVPKEYALSQNYPNPFNPSTSIEFSLPFNSDVRLTVYNLLGQIVTELVNEEIIAGNYSVVWNGTDNNGLKVSSGVYLYKLQATGTNGKEFQQIRKMVLLK